MTLRAVLFDAGNTLLFLDYARLADEVGAALALPLDAEALARSAPEAARAVEGRGAATDRDRAAAYFEALFRLAGVPESRWPEVGECLTRMHDEVHLWSSTREGTAEALGRLRAAGLRLGVVSNSDGMVRRALEAAGLLGYFEVVVDSGELGVEKPDPAIFHAALSALEVRPDEAVYVGDLFDVDVVGARAAGLQAVLFAPEPAPNGCRHAATVGALADDLLRRGVPHDDVPREET